MGKYLRATATYSDSVSSPDTENTAKEVSDNRVRAAPEDNIEPSFSETNPTRSIAENVQDGTAIGAPVSAIDTGDILTYTLGGVDAASFDIVTRSGQLQTKADLDYETKTATQSPCRSVTARMTSGDPDTETDATTDVTIDVTNVDEPGTVTLSSSQPQEGTVLTASLTDPDVVSGNPTWRWARADSRKRFLY